jgi:adenosylhomocysteine nucleosidase
MRGIPFYAIKAISDPLGAKLPDFNRFLSQQGQFRTFRFSIYAALRPWYWPSLARMGENSRKASQSITESLSNFLNE